jgi:hypothetical protein
MVTASSSPHYIVTRHSDRSTYTCVCCFPPFRTRIHSGCWAGLSLLSPPPPFFHFIFLFFSMGDGQPNDGVRQNFFYRCVVTENTRGLPHWSSKGFRSRVALIQPAKINSFVVMVVGWGGGLSRESKVFPLSISLWWWESIVSVYWLLYRCLGQMNVLIRREKHDGRIEWAMSVWDVSSWALQCGGKVFRRTPFVMFTNKVFRANVNLSLVLRVKSAHDHEFTPNRLRSESEEKRNWISRLDHEPVVSR